MQHRYLFLRRRVQALIAFAIAVCAGISSCVMKDPAVAGTETGNPAPTQIAGILYNSDGSQASGVTVILRPRNYQGQSDVFEKPGDALNKP